MTVETTTSAVAAVKCRWCGKLHGEGRCPDVKSMEYHPDGTVKRVEFYAPSDYAPRVGTDPFALPPVRWTEPFQRMPWDITCYGGDFQG